MGFVGEDGNIHYGEEPLQAHQPAVILSGELLAGNLARTNQTSRVQKLLAPVVPTDIFCIGLNYMKHYEESAKKRGIPLPDKPVIFMKPSSALAHPGQDIWMPRIDHGEEFDWEVELTIVIGKECRNVSREDALNYVFGYTV